MFTVLKVRADQKRGDFSDPGWYPHPKGEVAYEFTGTLPEPARSFTAGGQSMPLARKSSQNVEMRVRKPAGGGHGSH
jgi:hypothetical protein